MDKETAKSLTTLQRRKRNSTMGPICREALALARESELETDALTLIVKAEIDDNVVVTGKNPIVGRLEERERDRVVLRQHSCEEPITVPLEPGARILRAMTTNEMFCR